MRPATLARHNLRWADLAERSVAIWGLGVEGKANARAALAAGANVHLVDSGQAGATIESLPPELIASGDADTLFAADVVVKTPGISRYQNRVAELEAAGIPVVGGHGLWLNGIDGAKVAAVTGTKGKSTTTAVVGHYFDRLGIDGAIGGNIGAPPYDPVAVSADPAFWCIELSSYQVTDLAVRPKVAVVTSLSPDHVEWHRSTGAYYADKLSLLGLAPSANGAVRLGGSHGGELAAKAEMFGYELDWVAVDERATNAAAALGLRGVHNDANVAIAIAIIETLTGQTFATEQLVDAAEGFALLGSRLTPVGQVGGVAFIDDCLATNTLPTVAALDVFAGGPAAVIVGGFDRGIDYTPLAERLSAAANQTPNPVLVLCLDAPDNGPAIAALIGETKPSPMVTVELTDSVHQATERANAWCRGLGGGTVVLSPAAPTRGHALDAQGNPIRTRYANYQAKAAAFAAAIELLGRHS